MITKLRVLLACLGTFLVLNVTAQRAVHGSYTVTSGSDVLNTYTTLSVDASAGATSISVANNSMTGGPIFTGNPLQQGDLILIIQMYGGTVDVNTTWAQGGAVYTLPASGLSNWPSFGQMLSYESVGLFERAEVTGTSGGSIIELSCGIANDYLESDGVQIVRIPRFDDLTVNNGAAIVPTLWDGSTGGIVALEVDGTLTMNAGSTISASAYGYRGGQVDNIFTNGAATTDLTYPNRFPGSWLGSEGSEKGEGIYGYHPEYDAIYSRYGTGAIGNGGGGAGYVNAGGGGGSNAEVAPAAYNGRGNPVGYAAAWALDAATTSSSGAGSGGYCLSLIDLDATLVGPVNAAWDGDARKNNGGYGGHPIPYNAARIFFGGGGGAGDQDSDQAGSGGRGGGIVYLVNYGTIAGSGTIEVNGEAGQNSNPNNDPIGFNAHRGNDGAGGGGAGGSVYIENAVAIPNTINIEAIGGDGGDHALLVNFGQTSEGGGPGGSGSGGVVRFSSGAPTQTVTAGANGISTSSHFVEFPPNGATEGSTGESNLPAPYFDLTPVHDTICAGQMANPAVTVNGSYSGTLEWFTQQFGGTPIAGQTDQLTYNVSPGTTTSYWVGVCPGTFRVEVIVTVTGGATLVTTDPAAVCAPATVNITLPAVTAGSDAGTLSYWQDNAATITQTMPTTVGGGWHYIQLDASGCTAIDSVFVTVNPLDDATFSYSAASYCADDTDPTPTITGLGGGGFTSTPVGLSINGSTGQIDVSASTPNTYTVTYTTTGPCPNSSDVSVTITALDDATFSYSAASYCVDDTDPTPTATLGGGGYTSSPVGLSINGTTGQIDLSLSLPNTYTVTYTTAGACPNSSDVSVTVTGLDDASFSYSAASYCTSESDPTPTITGVMSGGFTSSPAGLSINAGTGIIDLSASTPNVYTVTYTTTGTCPNTSNVMVTVTTLDDATFSYSAASYCPNDADPSPTPTIPGGSYSSVPVGLSINATTGVIDVSASTANTYTVTYTTAGSCSNSSDVSVTINPLDNATFSSFDFCASSVNTISGVVTGGGVFSIQSQTGTATINSGTGILSGYNAGDQVIIEYTTPAGGCQNSFTQTVNVTNLDDPSFTTGDFCATGVNIISGVATPSGTFSITAQTGSASINAMTGVLSGFAVGDQVTIQYATPAGGCQDSSTQVVNVLGLDDATFVSSDFCASGTNTISGVVTGGGMYSIQSQTGSGSATINGSTGILSNFSGGDQVTILYTTAGACPNTSTQIVNVAPTPLITTTPTAISGCNANDGSIAVADAGNASGTGVVTWTGPVSGNSGAMTLPYSITMLPPGTYDVTFTDNATGCTSAISQESFVNPAAPNIDPVASDSDCDSLQLPGITGSGLSGSQAYFDGPNGTGNQYNVGDWISTTTTLYAYDASGACSDEETFTYTVHGIPVAAFTANPTSGCTLPHIVFFTDQSTLPDTWFWDFGDLNTSTLQNPVHSYTSYGNFTVTLTVTDTIVGCSDQITTTIVVNTAPVLDPVANLSGCDSVQLVAITGTNTSGNEAYYTGANGTGTLYHSGDWVMTGGTYYAYDTSNVCSNEQSFTVTINVSPTISGPTDVCIGSAIALSGTGTPDGVTPWVSSDVLVATVDNSGNVTGVTAGSSTITYLDASGCSNTTVVTVNALPTITGTATVCLNGTTNLNGSGTPHGVTPWSSSDVLVATVDNLGNVSGVAAGTATITYMNDLGCTEDTLIMVNPLDDPFFITNDFCASSTNVISGVVTTGGTYSITTQTGAATINPMTGLLSGHAAGDQITIQYVTPVSGCPDSTTVTVNVTPLDDPTFITSDFCESSTNVISGIVTAGGTFSIVTQTGSATIDSGTGVLSNFAAGDQITVQYLTPASGCQDSSTVVVNVTMQDDASFTTVDFCESDVNVISAVATPGGTFAIQTQTGAATIDGSTGELSGMAGGDQITIEYTTPAGACQNTSTQTVNVISSDDGAFTMTATCDGGTATITGLAGGSFAFTTTPGDLAAVEAVSGTVSGGTGGTTYSVDYTTNGTCPVTTTQTVVALDADDASFALTPTCDGASAIILGSVGGTFSQISGGGTIDVATGTVTGASYNEVLEVQYVTAGACPDSTIELITVDDCTPNDIVIPTAFTPGSDGANDTWEIVSLDQLYPDNIVIVYNRWGSKVFEHNSSAMDPYASSQWDGTFKGTLLPIASYYYIVDSNDGSGTKFQGTVTIVQ